MADKKPRDLEGVETWDYQNAVRKPGVKTARVVVSVAFPRNDFERIAQHAEQVGKKTSEFIREAALEKAASQAGLAEFHPSGAGSGTFLISSQLPPVATASGFTKSQTEPLELVMR